MKRMIAFLLALLMMTACCAFAEEPAEQETAEAVLTGPWYGDLNGIPFCLDLGEDGTYSVAVNGLPDAGAEGTWEWKDGAILLDGDAELPILVVNDQLYFQALDQFLTREEQKAYVPEDVLAGEDSDLSLFQGAWASKYVLLDGAVVPAEALQDDTILYVEESKAALTGNLFGEIVADFTYDNGAMVLTAGGLTVKLEMQKDLLMRMTVSSEGEDLVFVLSPCRTELMSSSLEGPEAEAEDPAE